LAGALPQTPLDLGVLRLRKRGKGKGGKGREGRRRGWAGVDDYADFELAMGLAGVKVVGYILAVKILFKVFI